MCLSEWTDDLSRRISVTAACSSGSGPNGVAGDCRGTSCGSPPAAHLHVGSRAGPRRGALLGARRQLAGGPTGRPVASRSVDGRSFPAAERAVHPLWPPSAGQGGRDRRGAPSRAPRSRSTAPRGAAGPPGGIFTFRRRSLAVAARADFVYFVFGLFAAFVSTIYMRKRKVIILVVLRGHIDLISRNVETVFPVRPA